MRLAALGVEGEEWVVCRVRESLRTCLRMRCDVKAMREAQQWRFDVEDCSCHVFSFRSSKLLHNFPMPWSCCYFSFQLKSFPPRRQIHETLLFWVNDRNWAVQQQQERNVWQTEKLFLKNFLSFAFELANESNGLTLFPILNRAI